MSSSSLLLLHLGSLLLSFRPFDLNLAPAELAEHLNDILALNSCLTLLLRWVEVHEPLEADRG